jgi:hypothetical protein
MPPPRRGTNTPPPAPGPRSAPTKPSVPRAKREEATPSPPVVPRRGETPPDRARTLPEIPAPEVTPPSKTATKPAVPRAKREGAISSAAVDFAVLRQYLNALPEGFESYPRALASGAVVLGLLLDPAQRLPLGMGLPSPLEDLIRTPPAASAWIPLVTLCALQAAVYDFAFADTGGVPAYEERTFQRSLQLTDNPLYRKILAVESPEALLASCSSGRWSTFYRGPSLHVMNVARGSASLRLTHPAAAWPGISRIALGAALRAAFIIARAKSATVTSRELSIRASHFEIRWS